MQIRHGEEVKDLRQETRQSISYFVTGLYLLPLLTLLFLLRDVATAWQLVVAGGLLAFGMMIGLLRPFLLDCPGLDQFSLFCVISAMRSLLIGEAVIDLLPQVSKSVQSSFAFAINLTWVIVILSFVAAIYQPPALQSVGNRFRATLMILLVVVGSGLFVLSQPGLVIMSLAMLLIQLFSLAIVFFAALRGETDAWPMLGSLVALAITEVFEVIDPEGGHAIYQPGLDVGIMFVVLIVMAFILSERGVRTSLQRKEDTLRLQEANKLREKIHTTEMAFLQAQIKPHFLYNALGAISNVCEKDGRKASQLIDDLAVYLRNSLEFNNPQRLSTIDAELEFVNTYIHIEQARFGSRVRIRYTIDVPPETALPVLVLQPLVENAVRHGISKQVAGGTIHLSARPVEDGVRYCIDDDGGGMTAQQIEKVFNLDQPSSSVGLRNIHYRLTKLYGSGLTITSELGRGTHVEFTIPQEVNP